MNKFHCVVLTISLLIGHPASAETVQSPTSDTAATEQLPAPKAPVPMPDGAIEAPFGLFWGMTKEDLDVRGVALVADSDTSLGAVYTATSLPKTVADVEAVRLFLGFGGKLFKVIAVSREYDNDPYGSEVQARYEEVAAVLKEKYGVGKEKKHIADMYDGNNWAFGLRSNENWRYTDYESNDLKVQISCRASGLANPFWVLVYEYKSGSELEEKAQKDHEKGAL